MNEEKAKKIDGAEAPSKEAPIVLEYPKAKWWRRLFAFLLDFICAAVLAACLAAGGDAILNKSSRYVADQQTMTSIELSSSLYIESGGSVVQITNAWALSTSSSTPSEADYKRVDDDYEAALNEFYANPNFFPDGDGAKKYLALKVGDECLKQSDKKTPYWHYVSQEGGTTTLEPTVNYEKLSSFYVTAIDDNAIPLISSTRSDYIDASRYIFWSTFLVIYLLALFSLFLVYCIVPLFFRRGYQTFGKKLFKISLINAHAVSPSAKQYWVRSLLLFFIEFVLGSASFLIPIFVSFTMMMVRKDGQCFHDYVAGTYVVDTSDDTVYFSYDEYRKRNEKLDSMVLKNTTDLSEK